MKTLLKRTIPHEVEIPLSGAEIADLFWELDEHAQAEFFNRLCGKDRLVFQLQAVTDAENLTSAGRSVMARIGEYSEANVLFIDRSGGKVQPLNSLRFCRI